jgi:hypothetical protein
MIGYIPFRTGGYKQYLSVCPPKHRFFQRPPVRKTGRCTGNAVSGKGAGSAGKDPEKRGQVFFMRQRERNARTAKGRAGERDACVVRTGGVVIAGCIGVTEVVVSVVVVISGAPGVAGGVTGPVNCDRENPYTVDESTTAITDPSPLTTTEPALTGFLVVEDPSSVPARS